MGHMKDFDIRIRNGGDDAIEAVSELMPQWIPVSERLPDDRVRVLACYDGRVVTAELFEGLWHWIEGKTFTTHVTHWMPLPEPPAS